MEISKAREKAIGQIRQLSKRLSRLMHCSPRCCMTLSVVAFIIISTALIRSHRGNSASFDSGRASRLHKLSLNTCQKPLNEVKRLETISTDSDETNEDYFTYNYDDLAWSNETVELFQDQLGVVIESGTDNDKHEHAGNENFKCSGEFLMAALPGPDAENNFYEVLWQYFSLDAVEHMTIMCGSGGKLTLKAVITERMKTKLERVYVG
jgi:hypothetical protein